MKRLKLSVMLLCFLWSGSSTGMFAEETIPIESIVGCLTAGCHGDRDNSKPAWQRAGRIWFDEDPHSQAYTNLLASKSKAIAEKLLQKSFASTDDVEYRRFLKDRCVSCHAAPNATDAQLVLGVDCQACHGRSSEWGSDHYAPATLAKGPARFDGTNRINTDDFATRARTCVACHIGDLDSPTGRKEVDHDLMAAGHPPMHFDFETFLRVYPAHWNRENDLKRFGPTVSNRRWQIGQLVSIDARLKLLAARCREAGSLPPLVRSSEGVAESTGPDSESSTTSQTTRDSKRTWPELTEYSCFSCHHSLVQPSWRQERTAQKALVWDTWLTSGLSQALNDTASDDLKARMSLLQTKMIKTPFEYKEIAELSQALSNEIDAKIRQLSLTPPDTTQQLIAALQSALAESTVGYDWESSVQWLNSVTAKEAALTKPIATSSKPPPVHDNLQVNFLDGPAHYDPSKIQMKRSQIEELLRKVTP